MEEGREGFNALKSERLSSEGTSPPPISFTNPHPLRTRLHPRVINQKPIPQRHWNPKKSENVYRRRRDS